MAVSRHDPARTYKTPTVRESLRRAFQGGLANRVSNRALRRQAQYAITHGRQAYATLLAVLAQAGGSLVVTQGTLDQVDQHYNTLGFVVERQEHRHGAFVVRLVDERDAVPAGAARDEPTILRVGGDETADVQSTV